MKTWIVIQTNTTQSTDLTKKPVQIDCKTPFRVVKWGSCTFQSDEEKVDVEI